MTTTSVDVIIPATRGRVALEAALASVEAVARDGGDRLEIEVHAVDGRGRTAAAARNEAAGRGRGEFIALLDDDDRWLPGRLLPALAALRSRPEFALVCGDATLCSGGSFLPPSWRRAGVRTHRDLALVGGVAASTVTLSRRSWEAAGGMAAELDRAEDFDFWLRLTAGGAPLLVLPQPLAQLASGPGRLSSDAVGMAEATLRALDRSCVLGEGDPAVRARRGVLLATLAHGAADRGCAEAWRPAVAALQRAPTSTHAWKGAARALAALAGTLVPPDHGNK